MKKITPVQIWKDGAFIEADTLSMYVTHDNLVDSATFCYLIGTEDQPGLSTGNLTMDAEEYAAWGKEADINKSAYLWACSKLNLTLAQI